MADRPFLDQVNIVVRDMDASVRFYEALGAEFPTWQPDWDGHHRDSPSEDGADVDLDSTSFAPVWCEGWPADTPGIVVTFRVTERDEVDRLHGELVDRGGRSLQAPYDAFFGCRFAVVADPDGLAVGVMSVPDPEMRRPPPDPAEFAQAP